MNLQTQYQIMTSATFAKIFGMFLYANIALYGSISLIHLTIWLISFAVPVFLMINYAKDDQNKNLKEEKNNYYISSIFLILAIISGLFDFSTLSFVLFLIALFSDSISKFILFKNKTIDSKQFLLSIPCTILFSLFFIFTFLNKEIEISFLLIASIPLFFYNKEEIIKKLTQLK